MAASVKIVAFAAILAITVCTSLAKPGNEKKSGKKPRYEVLEIDGEKFEYEVRERLVERRKPVKCRDDEVLCLKRMACVSKDGRKLRDPNDPEQFKRENAMFKPRDDRPRDRARDRHHGNGMRAVRCEDHEVFCLKRGRCVAVKAPPADRKDPRKMGMIEGHDFDRRAEIIWKNGRDP